MSFDMGVFALQQLVSSLVVIGPILIMVGLFNFVFTQNRKLVMAYILSGLFLTLIGAWNLYLDFGRGRSPQGNSEAEEISLEEQKELKQVL